CPDMAIGLPVPRPALRLVRSTQGNIRMCFSHDQNEDVTERMTEFSRSYMDKLKDVSGFVVCAKSPSCGMERVRVYDENG
ncbi:2-thiouracil desulfurase family protein, partial [Escherichia coli]|nr:2-thiouracil desulfurase family protein [Escherichia coli]